MKKSLFKNFALVSVITLGGTLTAMAAHLSERITFTARMNGAQEVPSVTTNAAGVATFTLNGNRDSLCVSVFMGGFSTTLNGIHLHAGAAGTNGGVEVDLTPYLSNNTIQTVLTGSNLPASLVENMIQGNIYLNAHTSNNANGEIRGQVKLETDFAYRSLLNGMKEVPSSASNATGLGYFDLSLNKNRMDFAISAAGLSGEITGAHLHVGSATVAGGVAIDLSSFISGNTLVGNVNVASVENFIDSLEKGSVYINIHTASFPNGEIRSQLTSDKDVTFDSFLNTASETTPPTTTTARGTAYFSINPQFTTLTYEVQATDLTGAIMGAHLHQGAAGTAGPVITDLSSGVNGNRISGTITGADLTQELIHDLLNGNIYLNIHTAANANGEIRGQVSRLTREGYSINMTGSQEVPGVSTDANGGGIVSISRDRNNVHVMLVAQNLSGAVGGAHFHNAAAGMNGDVMYDLSSFFSGTENFDDAYGYLTSDDATPFVIADEAKFRNNQVYVNIHTMTNPTGEIRGQVLRGSECNSISTAGIRELNTESTIQVYPNPTTGGLTVSLENFQGNEQLTLTDLYGKVIQIIAPNSSKTAINMTNVQAGIYILKVNGTQSVRIVKQ
jgi:hypothetical protein